MCACVFPSDFYPSAAVHWSGRWEVVEVYERASKIDIPAALFLWPPVSATAVQFSFFLGSGWVRQGAWWGGYWLTGYLVSGESLVREVGKGFVALRSIVCFFALLLASPRWLHFTFLTIYLFSLIFISFSFIFSCFSFVIVASEALSAPNLGIPRAFSFSFFRKSQHEMMHPCNYKNIVQKFTIGGFSRFSRGWRCGVRG